MKRFKEKIIFICCDYLRLEIKMKKKEENCCYYKMFGFSKICNWLRSIYSKLFLLKFLDILDFYWMDYLLNVIFFDL